MSNFNDIFNRQENNYSSILINKSVGKLPQITFQHYLLIFNFIMRAPNRLAVWIQYESVNLSVLSHKNMV